MKKRKSPAKKLLNRKIKLPLFVSFEGGEGAGKTTLINHLHDFLQREGYQVVVTREPGGSRLGYQIRELLLHHGKEVKISDKAELFLFLSSRAQHVEEVIQPALSEDKIILCDRFSDSSIAYQGFARGLGMDEVEALCDYSTNGVSPHLTIYLDIDPKIGLKRALKAAKVTGTKGKPDRIEAQKHQFHLLVRKAFLKLAKKHPNRIKVIDAEKTAQEVFEETLALL